MLLLGVHSHPKSTNNKVSNPTHPSCLPMELGDARQHYSCWPGSLELSTCNSLVKLQFFWCQHYQAALFLPWHTRVARAKRTTLLILNVGKYHGQPWLPPSALFSCSFASLHWLVMAHTPPHNAKENVLLSYQTDVWIHSYVLQLLYLNCNLPSRIHTISHLHKVMLLK